MQRVAHSQRNIKLRLKYILRLSVTVIVRSVVVEKDVAAPTKHPGGVHLGAARGVRAGHQLPVLAALGDLPHLLRDVSYRFALP